MKFSNLLIFMILFVLFISAIVGHTIPYVSEG